MTLPIPPLPAHDSTDWDTNWAAPVNAKLAEFEARITALATTVAALTGTTGTLVTSINGITPDPSGDVALAAADVGAKDAGWTPGVGDLPLTVPQFVNQNASGVWPTAIATDGTADYTGGTNTASVRPHAKASPVIFRGDSNSPASVGSGTAGMLRGVDERAIPGP